MKGPIGHDEQIERGKPHWPLPCKVKREGAWIPPPISAVAESDWNDREQANARSFKILSILAV
ncbi:MAG: hypothetical protein HY200_06375 [Nitrospirae bacterium]|nr:hypothetical protein [Nitrospirota bacterium]